MSHDVYVVTTCDNCGSDCKYDANYTSNVAGMWADAIGYPLADMHGRRAGDCIAVLAAAVARMDADRPRYTAMDPPNGWGDAEGARDYLDGLLQACRRWPNGQIEVSR